MLIARHAIEGKETKRATNKNKNTTDLCILRNIHLFNHIRLCYPEQYPEAKRNNIHVPYMSP